MFWLTMLVAAMATTGGVREGKATHYSPGLMERVAKVRHIDLGGTTGFATYPSCGALGKVLYVSVQDPRDKHWSPWHTKRVVDCSRPRDYRRHVNEGLVELSYRDAVKYGYVDEGRTRVRFYLAK